MPDSRQAFKLTITRPDGTLWHETIGRAGVRYEDTGIFHVVWEAPGGTVHSEAFWIDSLRQVRPCRIGHCMTLERIEHAD